MGTYGKEGRREGGGYTHPKRKFPSDFTRYGIHNKCPSYNRMIPLQSFHHNFWRLSPNLLQVQCAKLLMESTGN